ncbi:MAG: PaaI family thioesterase [Proteobacteria bacterium]|nr:PaaI family thioesterase [Pseudomonadota bacterium]
MLEVADRADCTLLPNGDFHNCFGCSPKNDRGMHMDFYANPEKDAVFSWYSAPNHLCGWGPVVHGGIVATILDEAMGWACITVLRRLFFSRSISVDFFKPVISGREIVAAGRVLKVNGEREAVLEGIIYNEKREICAKSSSVVSLFTIQALREMGVMDEATLSRFESMWRPAGATGRAGRD